MELYGYPEPIHSAWKKTVVSQFHFTSRARTRAAFATATCSSSGGARVRVIHAPGHTRGHCLFHVEPDDLVYLADIDLSSFGPYYGDAWSDLEDFERTLEAVRKLDARWYATFHHVGVIEGRDAYLERLDRFSAVIADRERRLLEYLAEPHSIAEIAEHRFVYRPQDPVPFAEAVERRSMSQHVSRLLRAGRVREVEPGRFRRTDRMKTLVRYEVEGSIATITLDRPEKRNAMSFAMLGEFNRAVERAGADPEARVVIVTGSGGSFCAGTDLSDLSSVPGEQRGGRARVAREERAGGRWSTARSR